MNHVLQSPDCLVFEARSTAAMVSEGGDTAPVWARAGHPQVKVRSAQAHRVAVDLVLEGKGFPG